MDRIVVESLSATPVARQAVELVERKGLGHPDTICDLLAEAISGALCRRYVELSGRVLHHNIENAFLVAGASVPELGGGVMKAPIRFIYGDHATTEIDGVKVPVDEIAEQASKSWIREHLPLIDPEQHVVFQNELRPGSVQLTDIFAREVVGANDTCVGSGYAPLTETEAVVLATEKYVNSAEFKGRFPETGQDVKVTGFRRGGRLRLVLSLAFVGARIPDERTYFERKEAIGQALHRFVSGRLRELDATDIAINTLDRPGRGTAGLYLTVLGTSADGADGGQVGRGNRPNGLNAFHRPIAAGAVAGKNPASNVGKIYNLFAGELARLIHESVGGLDEVYVTLCSRIGDPLDQPWVAAVRVVPAAGVRAAEVQDVIAATVQGELPRIWAFADDLARSGRPVC